MNNFNLYLDNLVDQGYDITLMKYYFEMFYCYGGRYDDEDGSGYECGHGLEFGHGYGYGYGYGYGLAYDSGYN